MPNQYYTDVFVKNLTAETTVVLNEGGARSSKSHSLCQLFIHKLLTEKNKKLLITRKTLPALRITAYKMFFDILADLKLYDVNSHNKTNRTYTMNSNFLLFTSLDYPTKIQSTEFNYIWMEEAEEFTFDDFIVLKTRLSAPNSKHKNRIYLTFNPKNENSYINKKVRFHNDVTFIKSTYQNNPFLSEEYKENIESLKSQDAKLYSIYALGEYAQIEGQIYTHIRSANSYPIKFDEVIYGLDYGFNNPSCLLKIGILDKIYYVTELFYLSKLTSSDIIALLERNSIGRRDLIYIDPSATDKITEIKRSGYNAVSAENSVTAGIDFCKRQKIYTRKANTNFNNEINEYIWRKDNNGDHIDLPVKYNDHAMDALRYAIYTHSAKKRCEPSIRWINLRY